MSRLAIAHLTDHDDVGVLAQDGAQGAGKAQADLLVHLDLVDAFELVLHRLFHGDDLVGAGIQLGQRGVQRGGFARPGGAGDEQNAVRARQQAVEMLKVPGRKTHRFEAVAHAGTVQHAHHHALAMHRGNGGDAQVKLTALDAGFDAAVLRQAAFGNVQVRHELDA